jgi:hypothetical protein
VALVVVAVARRRLGPGSSASTSTVDQALPSPAVQLRCWSRPTTTTRLPFDSDWLACSAWSRQTTGCRTTPPAPGDRRWRPGTWPGRSRPRCAVARVVGEVAGEAHARLGHGASLLGLSGWAVCPALGPGGRWVPWHATRPPGASGGANEVDPTGSTAERGSARVPGWLVECLRLGSGMPGTVRPAPSTPERGRRARLPPRGPLAGPSQATPGESCFA